MNPPATAPSEQPASTEEPKVRLEFVIPEEPPVLEGRKEIAQEVEVLLKKPIKVEVTISCP